MAAAEGDVFSAVPNRLPVRYSAIARRSAAVRLFAIVTIAPVSMAARTRSGVMERNASRCGARLMPASWHCEQFRW